MPAEVPLKNKIASGLKALAIRQDADLVTRLCQLLTLLNKWNAAYNLTAIRDLNEMVTHHLFDSLSIVPYLHGNRILDVGTGAGFPGLPLALLFPTMRFHLIDSNGKKTRFLTQAIQELKLSNVTVHQCRVEQFQPEYLFDCIVSRAFSQLEDMVNKTRHLCAADGVFLAMKGTYPEQELAQLDSTMRVDKVQSLAIPGLTAQRHLVILSQRASCL